MQTHIAHVLHGSRPVYDNEIDDCAVEWLTLVGEASGKTLRLIGEGYTVREWMLLLGPFSGDTADRPQTMHLIEEEASTVIIIRTV